jgi:hypothetical protein
MNDDYKVVSTNDDAVVYTKPTKCWCHWCVHPFNNVPVGIPVKYVLKKKTWYLRGLYCRWECVLAANRESRDSNFAERQSWVRILAKAMHGIKHMTPIPIAPPRQALQVFGGHMDIETFRKQTAEMVLQVPPIMVIIPEEMSILEKIQKHKHVPSLRNAPTKYLEPRPKYTLKTKVAKKRKIGSGLSLLEMGISIT